jgi:GTPase
VVELLHAVRREKGSVFVIDHDAEFQAAFENVVVVEFLNQRSQIKEASSEKQAAALRDNGLSVGAAVPAQARADAARSGRATV